MSPAGHRTGAFSWDGHDDLIPHNASPFRVKNAKAIRLFTVPTPDACFLSVGESHVHIPFEIKRFYYIYNFTTTSIIRGGHAHKSFEQVFFCVNGSFVFRLDDGCLQERVQMTEPSLGVYVGPELWHDMSDIANGTIILALASHVYNEADYIRDYQEFLRYIKR